MLSGSGSIVVTKRSGADELDDCLRNVRLSGDSSVRPYANALISVVPFCAEDLRPTAFYLVKRNLQDVRLLATRLAQLGVDIFDLSEIVSFEQEGQADRIGPPVVEIYREPEEQNNEVAAIVDGLHRFRVAWELGRTQIRCICIRNASAPLVPRPLRWDDVGIVDRVPSGAAKRSYRSAATDDDGRYFNFRDLKCLGSKGRRT